MSNFEQFFLQSRITARKILAAIGIVTVVSLIYYYYFSYYIVVRFNELGPLTKNMSAYYNGFKIGKIVQISPDKDFEHTLVRVNLIHRELNLPQNTTVRVEKFPNGELYLQFIYPSSPSFRKIKNGDVLEGMAPYSIEQFMLGQSVSGVTDIVSLHIIKALNAADVANQEMKIFFRSTSRIIDQNDKEIKQAVHNTAKMTESLAQMAENLNQTSKKLNDSLDENLVRETALNIKDSTLNVKDTTESIATATKDIDRTVKKIDETITHLSSTAQNLNSITTGLNQTLGKRFAGVRIMFGTPIKSGGCVKTAGK